MENRKTIAIDIDGVLADTDRHFITWYEKDHGVRVPYESILGKPEYEAFPEKGAIRKMVLTDGFFRTLPVMDGAVEAVKTLMESFEVFIVSAAMEFPKSLPEKYEWLQEHFPFISWKNIVFCGDKSIINAHYLIDDHPKNLDNFKGKPLMFHAAHNAFLNHHQRVKTWKEVIDVITQLENA